MDVDFRFEKGSEDAFEFGFVGNLDCEHITFGVGEIVVHHQLAGAVWIIDDESHDRTVRGVEDGRGDDMDVVVFQDRGEVVEPSHMVFGEDGELFHGIQSVGNSELGHGGGYNGEGGGER